MVSSSTATRATKQSSDDSSCFCKGAIDPARFMIECFHCDVWYHGSCVNITEESALNISRYACPTCQKKGKISQYTKEPDSSSEKIVPLPQRFANFSFQDISTELVDSSKAICEDKTSLEFRKLLKSGMFARSGIRKVLAKDVHLLLLKRVGFQEPLLIESETTMGNSDADRQPNPSPSAKQMGIVVPECTITMSDLEECMTNPTHPMRLLDVNSQLLQATTKEKWLQQRIQRKEGSYVVELSLQGCTLENQVAGPNAIKAIDFEWLYNSKYSTSSSSRYLYASYFGQSAYQDFTINSGGCSSWKYIHEGALWLYLIPPTKDNMKKYEQWIESPHKSSFFLGDVVEKCIKVELTRGMTFLLPSGWIYATFGVEAINVTFNGYFQHALNIPWLIHALELERSKPSHSFGMITFESAEKYLWFAAVYYKDLLESKKPKDSKRALDLAHLSHWERYGLMQLIPVLRSWINVKHTCTSSPKTADSSLSAKNNNYGVPEFVGPPGKLLNAFQSQLVNARTSSIKAMNDACSSSSSSLSSSSSDSGSLLSTLFSEKKKQQDRGPQYTNTLMKTTTVSSGSSNNTPSNRRTTGTSTAAKSKAKADPNGRCKCHLKKCLQCRNCIKRHCKCAKAISNTFGEQRTSTLSAKTSTYFTEPEGAELSIPSWLSQPPSSSGLDSTFKLTSQQQDNSGSAFDLDPLNSSIKDFMSPAVSDGVSSSPFSTSPMLSGDLFGWDPTSMGTSHCDTTDGLHLNGSSIPMPSSEPLVSMWTDSENEFLNDTHFDINLAIADHSANSTLEEIMSIPDLDKLTTEAGVAVGSSSDFHNAMKLEKTFGGCSPPPQSSSSSSSTAMELSVKQEIGDVSESTSNVFREKNHTRSPKTVRHPSTPLHSNSPLTPTRSSTPKSYSRPSIMTPTQVLHEEGQSSSLHSLHSETAPETPTSANTTAATPKHRASCHRCGNLRKKNIRCPSCVHIFCQRCGEKMIAEHGGQVFVNGCPVCKTVCCCGKNRSATCERKYHCYKKCPSTKRSKEKEAAGSTPSSKSSSSSTPKSAKSPRSSRAAPALKSGSQKDSHNGVSRSSTLSNSSKTNNITRPSLQHHQAFTHHQQLNEQKHKFKNKHKQQQSSHGMGTRENQLSKPEGFFSTNLRSSDLSAELTTEECCDLLFAELDKDLTLQDDPLFRMGTGGNMLQGCSPGGGFSTTSIGSTTTSADLSSLGLNTDDHSAMRHSHSVLDIGRVNQSQSFVDSAPPPSSAALSTVFHDIDVDLLDLESMHGSMPTTDSSLVSN